MSNRGGNGVSKKNITREEFKKMIVFAEQPFLVYDNTLGASVTSKAELAKLNKKTKTPTKVKAVPLGQQTLTSFVKKLDDKTFKDIDKATNQATNKQPEMPKPQQSKQTKQVRDDFELDDEYLVDDQTETQVTYEEEEESGAIEEGADDMEQEVNYEEEEVPASQIMDDEEFIVKKKPVQKSVNMDDDEDVTNDLFLVKKTNMAKKNVMPPKKPEPEQTKRASELYPKPVQQQQQQKKPVQKYEDESDDFDLETPRVTSSLNRLKRKEQELKQHQPPTKIQELQKVVQHKFQPETKTPTQKNKQQTNVIPSNARQSQEIDDDPPMIHKDSIRNKSKEVERQPPKESSPTEKQKQSPSYFQDKKRKETEPQNVSHKGQDREETIEGEEPDNGQSQTREEVVDIQDIIAESTRIMKSIQKKKPVEPIQHSHTNGELTEQRSEKRRKNASDDVQEISQNGMKNIPTPDVIKGTKKSQDKATKSASKGATQKRSAGGYRSKNKTEVSMHTMNNLVKLCSDETKKINEKKKKPFRIIDLIDKDEHDDVNEKRLVDFFYNALSWTYHFVPQTAKTNLFNDIPFNMKNDPKNINSFNNSSYLDFAKAYYAVVASREDVSLDHHSKDASAELEFD